MKNKNYNNWLKFFLILKYNIGQIYNINPIIMQI